MTLREDWMHVSKETVIPAQAGTHASAFRAAAKWVPAFAGMTIWAVCLLGLALPAAAAETPKRGGTLTYVIPADAPPSFDAHREETYATIHSTTPFYSVLIRANPYDPGKTDDLVCDLCTAMPKPTDDGKTYTFKIREGVKFTDGSPLTAADVAASWQQIVHPPQGYSSARESWYTMIDSITAPDPTTVVFHLKYATLTFL